jgi:hypothetical protein
MSAGDDLAKHYQARLVAQRRYAGLATVVAVVAMIAALLAFDSYTTADSAARVACRVVSTVVSVRDLSKDTAPDWVKDGRVDDALGACNEGGYFSGPSITPPSSRHR